ncbi:GNAT family N-acetyltransferase [Streptomyces sp. NPDC006879]|uniref:GNAT family N-acetyltransferase n=1 Tax=Streptomyces sp. NPDC006879 TaxID=3364767 RepID=UPI0036B1887C
MYELTRASDQDADAVAEVWLRSYDASLPDVRRAHSDEEVRAWFRQVVVPAGGTWVARPPGSAEIVGVMVLEAGVVEQLYLAPECRGRGLGDEFIALAKQLSPKGLELWTFQVNTSTHRFYERHGFSVVERTEGARNEEGEPDVRYRWRPAPEPGTKPRARA